MEVRPLDPGGEARRDGSAEVQDGDSLPGCQINRKTGKYTQRHGPPGIAIEVLELQALYCDG